jgi:hypothetical protein
MPVKLAVSSVVGIFLCVSDSVVLASSAYPCRIPLQSLRSSSGYREHAHNLPVNYSSVSPLHCSVSCFGCLSNSVVSDREPTPPWKSAAENRRRTVASLVKLKDVAKKFFTEVA